MVLLKSSAQRAPHSEKVKQIMDICQLSPHSAASVPAFMARFPVLVLGAGADSLLYAGIKSGSLIWVGIWDAY
jgi:hypothetical protein